MRRKSVHNKNERKVINMAKAGMKRPDPSEPHGTESKNNMPPVPEIQGKAKHGNKKAGPIH